MGLSCWVRNGSLVVRRRLEYELSGEGVFGVWRGSLVLCVCVCVQDAGLGAGGGGERVITGFG